MGPEQLLAQEKMLKPTDKTVLFHWEKRMEVYEEMFHHFHLTSITVASCGRVQMLKACLRMNIKCLALYRNEVHLKLLREDLLAWMTTESESNHGCHYYLKRDDLIEQLGLDPDEAVVSQHAAGLGDASSAGEDDKQGEPQKAGKDDNQEEPEEEGEDDEEPEEEEGEEEAEEDDQEPEEAEEDNQGEPAAKKHKGEGQAKGKGKAKAKGKAKSKAQGKAKAKAKAKVKGKAKGRPRASQSKPRARKSKSEWPKQFYVAGNLASVCSQRSAQVERRRAPGMRDEPRPARALWLPDTQQPMCWAMRAICGLFAMVVAHGRWTKPGAAPDACACRFQWSW